MKKRSIAILLLAAIGAASLILIFSANRNRADPAQDDVLSIGVGKIDGALSPFFEGSDGDETVKDIIYIKASSRERDSSPSASELSAASGMEVFFTDKDFVPAGSFSDGGYTAVKYTFKDGVLFSDGTPLEMNDVLFSLYMTLDPMSGVDKTPFLSLAGYTDYTYGKSGVSKEMKRAYEIMKNDVGEDASYGRSYTRQNAPDMRDILCSCGERFAEKIREYVTENYLTDEMISSYILDSLTASDVAESEALKNAYAVRMWNYGNFIYNYAKDDDGDFIGVEDRDGNVSVKASYEAALDDDAYFDYVEDEDGEYFFDSETSSYRIAEEDEAPRFSKRLNEKYVRVSRRSLAGFCDSEGTSYTLKDDSFPTMRDFFLLMKDAYVTDTGFDYEKMEKIEGASDYSFSAEAATEYALSHAKGDAVSGISGIVAGKETAGGKERDTLTLYFEGCVYDSAAYSNFYIVSMSSCTEGFDLTGEALSVCGAPTGSAAFFEHLKEVNCPVSCGPYVFSEYNEAEMSVYLKSNEYFSSLGSNNAVIKNVKMRDVSGDDASELLMSKDISINVAPIKKGASDSADSAIKTLYYPNNSYKYLLINPTYYKNLNVRAAIASTIDTKAIAKDAVTPISGYVPTYFDSYAENSAVLFDRDGSSASDHFEAAGYKTDDDGRLIDPATGDAARFVFTLLPEEKGGDVEKMILGSIKILEKLGAKGEIVYDPDLKKNAYSDEGVAIYVLGWEVDRSTSLYERYAYSSKTSAVKGCGIASLYASGQISKLGNVSYIDVDGKKKSATQSDAAEDVDRALIIGRSLADREKRCAAFITAQKILSALTFEIPLCEYNNAYQVNKDVVDLSSLYLDATSEKGPLSEIWNIRFAEDEN